MAEGKGITVSRKRCNYAGCSASVGKEFARVSATCYSAVWCCLNLFHLLPLSDSDSDMCERQRLAPANIRVTHKKRFLCRVSTRRRNVSEAMRLHAASAPLEKCWKRLGSPLYRQSCCSINQFVDQADHPLTHVAICGSAHVGTLQKFYYTENQRC